MEAKLQLHQQHTYNKMQVLYLTGMTEQQLSDLIVFTASEWADYFFFNIYNPNKIFDNGLYSRWFQYYWFEMDDVYVLPELYKIQKEYRFIHYRQSHQFVFDAAQPEVQTMKKDFLSMLPKFLQ